MNVGAVWKYDMNHWWLTNITPPNITAAFGGISVDPNNPQRLITSTLNQYLPQGGGGEGEWVCLSSNGGASWTTVLGTNSTKSTNGIDWIKNGKIHWGGTVVFDPYNPQTAWITSGNGLFKSSNLGDAKPDWTFDVKGIEEVVVQEVVSSPGGPLHTVLGDIGGLRHSNPYQDGQMSGVNLGTTTDVAIASGKPWLTARVGAGGMQMSSNWGIDWRAINSAIVDGGYQAWKGKLALSADGGVLLHGPENAATSYRSDNWGASWVKVGNLDIYGAQPVADATNPKMFYAYDNSNGKFWVSYDSGWTFWASNTVLPTGGTKRIGVPPGYGGEVWVPLYNGGLMRSTDSGKTFAKFNNVTTCGAIGFGKAAEGKSYPTIFIWGTVNGTRGLFRSTDVGNSWLRVNDDDHQYANYGGVVTGDMNTFGVVYMGTPGRGLVVGSP